MRKTERLAARMDKVLSEAGNRDIKNAWQERQGIRRLYCGAIATASLIPAEARRSVLSGTTKPGFTRIGEGSQQIAVHASNNPDTVIKVNRDHLTLPLHAQLAAAQKAEAVMLEIATIIGDDFIPPSEIVVTDNPLRYGPDLVAAILQERVYNGRDVFSLCQDELDALPDNILFATAELGKRALYAAENDSPMLPEIIGRNNLLFGVVCGIEGVWLVDTMGNTRSGLERPRDAFGRRAMDVYIKRAKKLINIA